MIGIIIYPNKIWDLIQTVENFKQNLFKNKNNFNEEISLHVNLKSKLRFKLKENECNEENWIIIYKKMRKNLSI